MTTQTLTQKYTKVEAGDLVETLVSQYAEAEDGPIEIPPGTEADVLYADDTCVEVGFNQHDIDGTDALMFVNEYKPVQASYWLTDVRKVI